ncbi:MAG TPA: uroporphyrinogen-III synthase, partial [Terracidiphilus sp.]
MVDISAALGCDGEQALLLKATQEARETALDGGSVAHASFNGLRVLSLESRRAKEIEKLICTYGGDATVVPSMREVGLESNGGVLEFAAGLLRGEFDLVIFLTGVGVRTMVELVQSRFDREEFLSALRKVKIAARGAKPAAALRELKVPVHVLSEEPSTWHELMRAIEEELGSSLAEMRVAIQEYGASNPELLTELSDRSRSLTKVPVYQWALPEDLQPLREAVLAIVNGAIDVVLFMTSVQVIHLFQVAEQMGLAHQLRDALGSVVVLSIGPTTSEELAHYDIQPDFEPSRPKMGFLVNEAAQYSARLLEEKRSRKIEAVVAETVDVKDEADQPSKSVRRVAESTPTMAGFRDGLAQIDVLHETRKAVDRAKSVLQRDMSLSEDEAYQMMHRESRQRRKSMREIADAILLAEELRRSQAR